MPKPVAGYLICRDSGLEGEPGIFYDYVLASNGLYIRSEDAHLRVAIPIAPCEVRGLALMGRKVELPHGKVPA